MKVISIFLALINALASLLLLAYTLSPENARHDIPFWLMAKTVAGSFVVVASILAWIDSVRPMSVKSMVLCSLLLIMLGVASTTWIVQLGIISGDMLNTLIVYGGSLTIQGITSLLSLFEAGGESSSPR